MQFKTMYSDSHKPLIPRFKPVRNITPIYHHSSTQVDGYLKTFSYTPTVLLLKAFGFLPEKLDGIF